MYPSVSELPSTLMLCPSSVASMQIAALRNHSSTGFPLIEFEKLFIIFICSPMFYVYLAVRMLYVID